MRKSHREQIESKCVHFNGLINDHCDAGVNYDSVGSKENRRDKPCFKGGSGECDKCRFPTEEEILEQINRSNLAFERAMKGMALKKEIKQEHGNSYGTGVKECPECGKNLSYRYYGNQNGHLHMHCETEDCISFME